MDLYDVQDVLRSIDAHPVPVLLAGAVANTGAYIMYLEGIRLGFRQRTYAIPVFANMYFFAHDVVFVGLFAHWFSEIDHWLFKLFWGALLVFAVLECVVHYQTIRFGRRELSPGLSPRQYVAGYVAVQAAVVVLFWFLYSNLGDPLFLVTFSTTIVVAVAWYIPLLLRRGGREGQSLLLASGLVLLNGYFLLFLPQLSDAFRTPVHYVTGATVAVVTLVYPWLLTRYPVAATGRPSRRTGATGSSAPRGSR
ncbi:hypothetical protein ACIBK9_33535 [Nonomuraea sp. NPDC050227]|uniref:hypothetical protein n=1 Tax=Nonomuraea sp. NPDC050227 TaxID=3364360 RepID=UPI0037887A4D